MPICEAYAKADAVFIGEVTRITPATIRIEQADGNYDQTAHVTVHEVFKGGQRRSIVLRQLGSRRTQKFIPGGRYLMYANHIPALKIWEVKACGPTRLAEIAQVDLRYLKGLLSNAKRTRIAGEVMELDLGGTAETTPVRLKGVRLKFAGGDREYEVTSDADGVYELYDLPPGRYTVSPEPPKGLIFLWAIHSGHDPISKAKSLEVALGDSGCVSLDILLTPDKSLKKDGEK